MARLRDVPHVLRTVGPFQFVKRVWRQGSDDQLMTWASALAYSWLFAVFPFFIFLMTLVPELPTDWVDTVKREIHDLIKFLPKDAADTLWLNVQQVLDAQPGARWLRALGLVFALWAASGGMSQTMAALDRCYELHETRPFWRHRLVALLMTVVIATLFLLVVVLLPVGGIVKAWIIRQGMMGFYEGAPWMVAFDVVRWGLAVFLMVCFLRVV
jgi:membrane protein